MNEEELRKELEKYLETSREIEEVDVEKIKAYQKGYRDGINTVLTIIQIKNSEDK